MNVGRLQYGCLLLCIVGAACQTTPKAPPETGEALPAMPRGYQPMSYVSSIQLAEGEYADLFSAGSFAVWVGDDVADMKYQKEAQEGAAPSERLVAQAREIRGDYFVFECHIESVFRDTSIAYDVVGFRGIDLCLETPGGNRIQPVQVIIGTPVEEEQRGALKLFRRTNIVVFPRQDLWTGGETLAVGSRSVRLVLSGHSSVFNFEWPELPQATMESGWKWKPSENETLQSLKVSFSDLYGRLRRLSHTFD